MQFSYAPLLIALASVTTTAAQYTVQSAPFNLIVTSKNETLNGTGLLAEHSGAAIESLALSSTKLAAGNATFQSFNFNTSTYTQTYTAKYGKPGYLTYRLPSEPAYSEALSFYNTANSNAALPLFEGTAGVQLAFDENDFLNYQTYVDDRTFPPTVQNGATTGYYRWYACMSYFEGYQYHTLNWVYGDQRPENPTCEKVMVKRLFI